MIPQETIDKIFETVQIQEVVSDFVELKKAGANYKGRCPFHNEKTPSFVERFILGNDSLVIYYLKLDQICI